MSDIEQEDINEIGTKAQAAKHALSSPVFNEAFSYAHSLGIKTSVGTETFVTIPKSMKERYRIEKETDEEIKEVYRGMFDRITKAYPLDYYWLWTPEYWTW